MRAKKLFNKKYSNDNLERPLPVKIIKKVKRTKNIPQYILHLLQQNKKQEAEDYIWENTVFNKNKT